MKNKNEKDKKRRFLFQQYEIERRTYQSIIHNMSLPSSVRMSATLFLNALPKNSSVVRIRNRCVVSGRSRGVYKDFRLSRLCFREVAKSGLLPGVYKASW